VDETAQVEHRQPYCAAKHALQGCTEAERCEVMHDEVPVQITMVQMPALDTLQVDWVKSRAKGRAQTRTPHLPARSPCKRHRAGCGAPTPRTMRGLLR
jgi:NAD(P)-dependent dehydrogenase (short-subunit alcohol dehydrogenase family)